MDRRGPTPAIQTAFRAARSLPRCEAVEWHVAQRAAGERGDPHELFEAILARPEDDDLRIVYADHLEERGDLPRATLLRTECALDGVPRYDARWLRHWSWKVDQREALALPSLPEGLRWATFATERGLPCRLKVIDVAAFFRHAAEVFAKAPITRLDVDARDPEFPLAQLLASPWMERLTSLRFEHGRFSSRSVRLLEEARRISKVVDLGFDFEGIALDGLRQLLRSPLAQRLERLGLRGSFFVEHGVPIRAAFTGAPSLPALRRLDLARNRLDATVLRPVLERVPGLQVLDLHENPLGDDGYRLIGASMRLRRLTNLDLNHTYPLRTGVRALAESSQLGELRALWLRNNRLGPNAARLLAAAPWRELRFLDVHGNRLLDHGVTALVGSPAFLLERIDARDNGLGPATAALAERWFWNVRPRLA